MSVASRPRPAPPRRAALVFLVPAVGLLVGGNAAGRPGLAAAIIIVQVIVGLSWLTLFAAATDAAVLVGLAVVATDVLLLRTRSATAGSIAGVIGLSVIAVLFHQLVRRDSRGVVGAISVTLSAIVLTTAFALLLPLRELPDGGTEVFAGVISAAVALAGVRVVPGPELVRRLLALVVGVLTGLGCGLPSGGLTPGAGTGLGAAVAVTVLLADRLMERIAGAEPVEGRARVYAGVIVPVTMLLPLALAAPIAYFAGRVIVSGGG